MDGRVDGAEGVEREGVEDPYILRSLNMFPKAGGVNDGVTDDGRLPSNARGVASIGVLSVIRFLLTR